MRFKSHGLIYQMRLPGLTNWVAWRINLHVLTRVKTWRNWNCSFCMTIRSSFCFVENKQTRPPLIVLAIFYFAFPLKYHVTFLLSHQSYSVWKDERYRGKIVNKVCFCEIKPPLANCGDGSWKNKLVGLPVFSQMFPLPTFCYYFSL